MIKPGWKRDVCPQCHMPGRVGEQFEKALKKTSKVKSFILMLWNGPSDLPWAVKTDICINCGVMYAYECKDIPNPGGSDAGKD